MAIDRHIHLSIYLSNHLFIYFKKFSYTIVGLGKSTVCRVGGRLQTQSRSEDCRTSRKKHRGKSLNAEEAEISEVTERTKQGMKR